MEIISVLQIPLFACLLNCPADGLSMKNCAAAGRIFRPGRFQPQIEIVTIVRLFMIILQVIWKQLLFVNKR